MGRKGARLVVVERELERGEEQGGKEEEVERELVSTSPRARLAGVRSLRQGLQRLDILLRTIVHYIYRLLHLTTRLAILTRLSNATTGLGDVEGGESFGSNLIDRSQRTLAFQTTASGDERPNASSIARLFDMSDRHCY